MRTAGLVPLGLGDGADDVCSVFGVLLMPGHTVLARVSSNLVDEVVQ